MLQRFHKAEAREIKICQLTLSCHQLTDLHFMNFKAFVVEKTD